MSNINHYKDSDDPRKRAAYYLVDLSWMYGDSWEIFQEASRKIVDDEYSSERIGEICEIVRNLKPTDSDYVENQKEKAIENLQKVLE